MTKKISWCCSIAFSAKKVTRSARPMVIGASPRLCLDSKYEEFFELFANGVAGAIAAARTREQARSRIEAAAVFEILKKRETELAREVTTISQLYRLSAQLLQPTSLHAALAQILDASIELIGADMALERHESRAKSDPLFELTK